MDSDSDLSVMDLDLDLDSAIAGLDTSLQHSRPICIALSV